MIRSLDPEKHDGNRSLVEQADVEAIVEAALGGDQEAWKVLVGRYAPLVWAICRRFGLGRPATDDVAQSVWLSLIEHLSALRTPAALPGWIATTTRRECLRVLQAARSQHGAEHRAALHAVEADGYQEGFEDIERALQRSWENAILRDAFAELRPGCQVLLRRLFAEARPSYSTVAAELNMKIGSIGPTRLRCLEELRRCPAFAALLETGRDVAKGGSTNDSR